MTAMWKMGFIASLLYNIVLLKTCVFGSLKIEKIAVVGSSCMHINLLGDIMVKCRLLGRLGHESGEGGGGVVGLQSSDLGSANC